jgi:hypothetical protein
MDIAIKPEWQLGSGLRTSQQFVRQPASCAKGGFSNALGNHGSAVTAALLLPKQSVSKSGP